LFFGQRGSWQHSVVVCSVSAAVYAVHVFLCARLLSNVHTVTAKDTLVSRVKWLVNTSVAALKWSYDTLPGVVDYVARIAVSYLGYTFKALVNWNRKTLPIVAAWLLATDTSTAVTLSEPRYIINTVRTEYNSSSQSASTNHSASVRSNLYRLKPSGDHSYRAGIRSFRY
jgi:hypothetical protein